MKTIITAIAFLGMSVALQAQKWSYFKKENKFENFHYEACVVSGTGEFPYSTPAFGVRKSENGIEFLIGGVINSSNGAKIKFYIDNGEVFEVYSVTADGDDGTYIFQMTKESQAKFISQLKSGNKVYFRIFAWEHQDYEFPLNGSSSSLSKMEL